ncbi:MFS transporter [Actinosynnema sp. NPDC047251]|uniref:Putative proline/betaine transporter n=1 Tax=Saccharothrix espanaensis (strain ATCC 51144 / DSM 44229 / JCM 9112 / NBRC 15066 / NRRL 15764) TaxID=1179773 RepID=K0JUR1_SACES|nr:MFS transporter [Saccharothrix espanaensis]CCH29676.1 Permease, MFS-type [Saccharothrix espanaensis DSM 44229]
MSTETPSRRGFARIVAASVAGTTIEFYDFFLYGTAAALVFDKVFFPSSDPLTGVLLALVTYAVGFLARPLGGVVFGHLGDRFGRRRTLSLSLIVMGSATVAIGLIPSYASIGVAAPVLLTVLRLVQGLALGGEWGGAVLLVAEHGSAARRGFWSSWPQTGGPLGNMIATGVLAVLGLGVTDEQFLGWGWRIPFLLSAVLVVIGIWLRHAVEESPLFLAAREAAQESGRESGREPGGEPGRGVAPDRAPIRTVLRDHRKPVLIAALANVGEKATYYTFSIFLISYLTQIVHLPKGTVLSAVTIASVFQVVAIPTGGLLADRFGRRPCSVVLAVLIAVWALVGLPLVDGGGFAGVVLVIVVGLTLHGLITGAQSAFFAELFPSEVRYTGASLGYQSATVVGGSLAPVVGVALLHRFPSTVPAALFLCATLACTVVAFLWAGETRQRDLRDIPAPSRVESEGSR